MTIHTRLTLVSVVFLLLGTGCSWNSYTTIVQQPVAQRPVTAPAVPAPQPAPAVPLIPATLPTTTQKMFTNAEFGYQLSYSAEFIVINAAEENAQLALSYPNSYMKGTNLSEAKITATAHLGFESSSAPKCLTHPYLGTPLTQTVMQDGYKFFTYDYEDAGAGQRYFYRTYQTMRENNCYTIMLQAHSSTIGNYDPSMHIKEYNHAKVIASFDSVFKTFKFTK